MARAKKTEEVKNDTITPEVKPDKKLEPKGGYKLYTKGGHVFYTVFSKSRGGFITESMNPEKACETVDSYWFEHRRNVAMGKWDHRRAFDMYIMKRDTGISSVHSELYYYAPGALSEARREAKMRERYGDDYRESEDADNFDSSKYM
jgi:hypothetical protein